MSGRVVLACSAETDLPAAVGRLAELTGAEVVAVAVDLGQRGADLARTRTLALAGGAVAAVAVDAREEYAQRHCLPALLANALHHEHTPLGPALSRPLLIRHLVAAARAHGAHTIAHDRADHQGFTAGVRALAPDLNVIAWAEAAPNPLAENVFCRAARIPDQTGPRDPEELTLTFDQGVPVAINGETVTVLQALQELNRRAGAHGIGRIDAVHQAPGASTLITAHRELEGAVLDAELARFKRQIERRWSELVHEGRWFSPLKDALDEFVLGTQEQVSGEVRLVLHGGRAVVTGRWQWDLQQDFTKQWTGV